ncbi:MAG: hypothetical protein KC432_05590 [Thermomicrobiales bacterium]|nr:hypothetical protein [Thermomicrobiales bacterium]
MIHRAGPAGATSADGRRVGATLRIAGAPSIRLATLTSLAARLGCLTRIGHTAAGRIRARLADQANATGRFTRAGATIHRLAAGLPARDRAAAISADDHARPGPAARPASLAPALAGGFVPVVLVTVLTTAATILRRAFVAIGDRQNGHGNQRAEQPTTRGCSKEEARQGIEAGQIHRSVPQCNKSDTARAHRNRLLNDDCIDSPLQISARLTDTPR